MQGHTFIEAPANMGGFTNNAPYPAPVDGEGKLNGLVGVGHPAWPRPPKGTEASGNGFFLFGL